MGKGQGEANKAKICLPKFLSSAGKFVTWRIDKIWNNLHISLKQDC